jgi:hypothetical protein
MLTVSEALDRAQMLCGAATKAGADAADALYYCNAATSVSMRLGALEDVERSEGQDISLRVFVGQRSASVSTADMDAGELAKLVERCVAMAREAPEDPYAGLAPEDRLFRGPVPDYDLDDGSEADPQALREAALAVEEAARAVAGVTNSEGGSASHSRTRFALATSHGFAGGYGSSGHSLSASRPSARCRYCSIRASAAASWAIFSPPSPAPPSRAAPASCSARRNNSFSTALSSSATIRTARAACVAAPSTAKACRLRRAIS